MQALQPLFSEKEEPGTKDNAAGAVSRMILALGSHLPLEQVSCFIELGATYVLHMVLMRPLIRHASQAPLLDLKSFQNDVMSTFCH